MDNFQDTAIHQVFPNKFAQQVCKVNMCAKYQKIGWWTKGPNFKTNKYKLESKSHLQRKAITEVNTS